LGIGTEGSFPGRLGCWRRRDWSSSAFLNAGYFALGPPAHSVKTAELYSSSIHRHGVSISNSLACLLHECVERTHVHGPVRIRGNSAAASKMARSVVNSWEKVVGCVLCRCSFVNLLCIVIRLLIAPFSSISLSFSIIYPSPYISESQCIRPLSPYPQPQRLGEPCKP
jgi:hypothetical protein